MNTTNYLTKQGLREAQAELEYLIKTRRPELIQALKESRSTSRGFSESAGCHYVIAEQSVLEQKIDALKALTEGARVIKDVNTNKVSVGTRVKLKFLGDDAIKTYSIVGTNEANPFENKISNESPLVKAILGKKVNDMAKVSLGFNRFKIRILGIYAQ